MARPVIVNVVEATSQATTTVSIPSVQVGDWIVATQAIDFVVASILVTPTGSGAPSSWTQIGAIAGDIASDNMKMRTWAKVATGSGTYTVSFVQTGNPDVNGSANLVIAYHLRGVISLDGTPTVGQGTSGTTQSLPATSPSTADSLLIGFWAGINFTGTQTYAKPTGTTPLWTEDSEITAASNASAMMAASAPLTASGSTGAKVATASPNADSGWAGKLMAFEGQQIVIETSSDSGTGTDSSAMVPTISRTDSGTGTETNTVAKTDMIGSSDSGTGTETNSLQQAYSSSDSGTGTDSTAVTAILHVSSSDSGTGTDTTDVDIPVLKESSDSGTGTEGVTSVLPVSDLTDSGTATETSSIARTSDSTDTATATDATAVLRGSSSTDSATGVETTTLSRDSTSSDSGTGTDVTQILRFSTSTDAATATDLTLSHGPLATDHGDATDVTTVVVIPFTQVLPLARHTVYDLVVVARVPQVNGPPTFIEVDPIEWQTLEYTNTLSVPQDLTAKCLISSVTDSVLQRLAQLHNLATELWLYRDGQVVFAGPVVGFQTSGEQLTITCKGLLAYLSLMVVASDQRFTAADQFTIVKTLVDQWQGLDYGNFGIDTSSVGLSGQTRDAIYLQEELHNVGTRVSDLSKSANGFDVEVDPGSRKLTLWAPGKGTDRSTGEDAIVFDERNITSGDILCSVAVGDLASEALGTATASGSDTTLYSTAANLELRARYGRSAVTGTWSDTTEQSVLDGFTAGLLNARNVALLVPGPNVRVTPDADLTDYAIGDTIAYELGSTLGIQGSFRIRSQKVTANPNGQEAVDLEFV